MQREKEVKEKLRALFLTPEQYHKSAGYNEAGWEAGRAAVSQRLVSAASALLPGPVTKQHSAIPDLVYKPPRIRQAVLVLIFWLASPNPAPVLSLLLFADRLCRKTKLGP